MRLFNAKQCGCCKAVTAGHGNRVDATVLLAWHRRSFRPVGPKITTLSGAARGVHQRA